MPAEFSDKLVPQSEQHSLAHDGAEAAESAEEQERREKIEKLSKEIEASLSFFKPRDPDAEVYAIRQFDDLLTDAEKFLLLSHEPVITDLKVLEKAKELLVSRLHAVVDDEHNNGVKSPDEAIVRSTRLALLGLHDDHDLDVNRYYGKVEGQDWDEGTFRTYLEYRVNRIVKKLSESEINALVDAGYGDLFPADSWDCDRLYESIPDSLFPQIAKRSTSYYTIEGALKKKQKSGEKYSKESFDALLNAGYGSMCLTHFSDFSGGDIFEAIRLYDPGYPFNANNIIEIIAKQGLDTPEVVEYVVEQYREGQLAGLYNTLKKYPNFNDTLADIHAINNMFSAGAHSKVTQNMTMRLITDGKASLIYGGTLWQQLLENDYDWLMEQISKHNQENLVIRDMKPETVSIYVKKLISNNDILMLKALFSDSEKVFFEHTLDGSLYNQIALLTEDVSVDESRFISIPAEVFKKKLESKDSLHDDRWIYGSIRSFDLGDVPELASYKEYQSFLNELDAHGLIQGQQDTTLYNAFGGPMNFSTFKDLSPDTRQNWLNLLTSLMGGREVGKFSVGPIIIAIGKVESEKPIISTLLSMPKEEIRTFCESSWKIYDTVSYDKKEQILTHLFRNYSAPDVVTLNGEILALETRLKESNLSDKSAILYKTALALKDSLIEAQNAKEKILTLLAEIPTADEDLVSLYLKVFSAKESTALERKKFLEELLTGAETAATNQPVESADKDMYRFVCEQVYPKRNYDSYQYIGEYQDRTKDLEDFKFNRKGYETKLDGLSGYKVKSGEVLDRKILEKYSGKVERLVALGTTEKLDAYLTAALGERELMPTTIEGKLGLYIQGKSEDEVSDIVFAYQLRTHYDEFVQGTRDQTDETTDPTEREHILLTELAERYGDRFKETVKELSESIATGPDKDLFITESSPAVLEATVAELSGRITADLQKIPEAKITDTVVRKKVVSTLKARFQKDTELKEYIDEIASIFTAASLPDIADVVKGLLLDFYAQRPAIGGLDKKRIEAIQDRAYQEIQKELEKYEEVMESDILKASLGVQEKGSKKRSVHGYFSKNKENAHARMVADVCLASDPKMLENPNYFEFVLFDEDRKKNIGTVMLLTMEDADGKKHLLYCPNPSVDIIAKVSAKKLHGWLLKHVSEFAKENGFDSVLTDTIHGRGTNRPGKFLEAFADSAMKDKSGKLKKVSLQKAHTLGGGYIYKDGLSVLWEKAA